MRVWVTGAGGLLGSALCRALASNGIDFRGSHRSEADVTNLASMTHYCQKNGPFTHIVHCAALTQVDAAEFNYEMARSINALSPGLVGAIAAREKMRVVHLSTDYVFDGRSNRPYLETDCLAPQTVYGQTKAEGERQLLAVLPDACIIRTSWLFGLTGKNFVSTILRLMQEKDEVKVVFDQVGRPTYAPDLANVLIAVLNWSGIYHAANSGQTTWHELAQAIFIEATAAELPICCRSIKPVTSAEFAAAAPRPPYSVLNTEKIEQKLGYPMRPWKDALLEYINAIR